MKKSMLSMMRRLVESCGKYKARIRLSYLTGFLKGMFMKSPLMLSFLMVCAFMEGSASKKDCLVIGGLLLGTVVIQTLLQHASDRLQSAAGYMVFADKRMELGDHFRRLSMGYFTEGNIGKVSSVLSTDMNFIEENCMMTLETIVSFLFSQIVMCAFMFYLDWRLGLLSLLLCGVFILIGNLMTGLTLRHSAEKQKRSEELAGSVLEFAEGIGIIKSFNLLGEKSRALTKRFEESCADSINFEKDYCPWATALTICYGTASALILLAAGYLTNKGFISGQYMIGMILFLFDTFNGIKSYYSQIARITVTDSCLDRIEGVFAQAEIKGDGTERIPLPSEEQKAPEIEFKNVNFSYGDKEALRNINFKAQSGQMVALVGQSGGGKSTVANLLARFWDVNEGSVMVRGKDIRSVPLSDLMKNISMVFQRVYLFQDTVFNNIAMGKSDATKEEVIEVAKKARCYDFIMNLPNGFDTVIGEGGADLSGGEMQRISIARCMLKDSPIVILDEATASVDADNERYIQEAISELCKGKTLIVIAHRLNTIKSADKILVIKNGQIIESGSHKELFDKGGEYKTMLEKQIGA
ncbi:MAG: ABC transporter ATP-binding protein/permease [Treponema sp.]|nr:ABC transporter ATP-binding protein/permease [Treponema sp.]